MCSGGDTRALPRVGSPIRKSAGRRLFSTSPRLIAAVHVLPRLLAPRHPPRALHILTKSTPLPLCSFQGTSPADERPARGHSVATLKTKQHAGASELHEFTRPFGFIPWFLVADAFRPGVDIASRASLARYSDRGNSNETTNRLGAQATLNGSHP